MDVREAGVDDLAGLMRIEQECFGIEKFSENTLKAFLFREDAFALVAVHEGVIVGAALCLCPRGRTEGRIASMAVLEGWRRKGVGTVLLAETEKRLGGRGARTFELEVEVSNEPAITLYLRHGYSLRGLIRDYYGAGRHAYFMEKVVPSGGQKVKVWPS